MASDMLGNIMKHINDAVDFLFDDGWIWIAPVVAVLVFYVVFFR